MQINNNELRGNKRSLPESTVQRIARIKELFKNARTMAEKEAVAKMLAQQSSLPA
ncbi:hypothetical protein NT6N_05510 [Oceaniferula spumae]|uniref:Uncharacterized protein n=1 Tax=Oceaniferula spumae TaxID=2979115 RepID=A0AAT9FHN4_9BACT